LIQEIDRYPEVEQAVADFAYFHSAELASNIDTSLNGILHNDGTPVKRRQQLKFMPLLTSREPTMSPSVSAMSSPSKQTPLSTPLHQGHFANISDDTTCHVASDLPPRTVTPSEMELDDDFRRPMVASSELDSAAGDIRSRVT